MYKNCIELTYHYLITVSRCNLIERILKAGCSAFQCRL